MKPIPVPRSSGNGLHHHHLAADRPGGREDTPFPFIGNDPRVREVLELVARVADTRATVLIQGESGTGKELIARSLHRQSSRSGGPFVAINCGAVPRSLLESEISGHTRGAFTGADCAKPGKYEAAHGGTIFFDELSEMSRPFQVGLLRILQTGEFTPVGAVESRYSDARVIAATNRDLVPLVGSGRFRQDLYYRINIIRIELPPLRERRGDLPLLAGHFLARFGREYGKPSIGLSEAALNALTAYDFPGNVRELENLLQRAVILCNADEIGLEHLTAEVLGQRPALAGATPPAGYHVARRHALRTFEESFLITKLRESGGIVSRAARRAGLSERNFHKKLGEYRIDFRSFRCGPSRP